MDGAKASANLYSLVQTCKAHGIDPYRYLRALFIALPKAATADDYEALLPWRIALAAQQPATRRLTGASDPHHGRKKKSGDVVY